MYEADSWNDFSQSSREMIEFDNVNWPEKKNCK